MKRIIAGGLNRDVIAHQEDKADKEDKVTQNDKAGYKALSSKRVYKSKAG